MELNELLTDMITDFIRRNVDVKQQFTAGEQMALIVAFGVQSTQEEMLREFDRVLCQSIPEIRQAVIDELYRPSGN